jgi:thiol-disulfide isomerase/thioredoxin
MIKKINFYIIFQILLFISLSNSQKYPKNRNILNFEKTDNINTIDCQSAEEIYSFINNYQYVIALFHADWCGHCKRFIPIFDEASKFVFVNKFKFLKINSNSKKATDAFGVDRFPTIKVFINGNELKIEPVRELIPLLEFLEKLINNPVININSKEDFIKEYGDFSPYIEYNEKQSEFISCINLLAKTDFLNIFYFGVKKINNNNLKEKISFDFDGTKIEYFWDGNCDNIKYFLENNIYPILNEITSSFIKSIQKNPKILIMFFYNEKNEKHKNFIHKQYKKLAIENRKYVFGYADKLKDTQLIEYFKINPYSPNINIVIFNFIKDIYYIHPNDFNINSSSIEKCENELKKIIENMDKLKFTTGNFLEDIFLNFGIHINSNTIFTYIMFFILLFLILFVIILILCVDNNDNKDIQKNEPNKSKKD